MEEKLDKLISLIESQNKALERSLNIINGIHTLMIEKYKAADLLLEQYPPIRSPSNPQVPISNNEQPAATRNDSIPINFNDYSDAIPYGVEMEEERAPVAQSFPPSPNAVSLPDQPATSGVGQEEVYTVPQQPQEQEPFREAPPEVPVTSRAEMMEQVEKRGTTSEP